MKKYFNIYSLAIIALLVLNGCEKEDKDEIEGLGNNFFKLVEANNEITVVGVDLKPGEVSVPLVEIVRDVNSSSELKNPTTVNIKIDNAVITTYNTAHKDVFEPLPINLYKLSESKVQLASGEFSKIVNIIFDPTKLTSGIKYAIGITLENSGQYKLRSGLDKALLQIIGKNKYHGKYYSEGYFTHPNPASSRAIGKNKELVTVNENTVTTELGDLGAAGYTMSLTVNADNSVTITNTGGTPALNVSYQKNFYDPATHSFNLKYSYNTTAPRIINEIITLQ